MKKNNWDLNIFILSKEKNKVVKTRAQKLSVDSYQG